MIYISTNFPLPRTLPKNNKHISCFQIHPLIEKMWSSKNVLGDSAFHLVFLVIPPLPTMTFSNYNTLLWHLAGPNMYVQMQHKSGMRQQYHNNNVLMYGIQF